MLNFDRKKVIILAAVIVIPLLVLGGAYYLYSSKDKQVTVDNVFDEGFKPDTETIILNTANGPININNIFKDAKIVSDGVQSSYIIDKGIEYAAGAGTNQFILTASDDKSDILTKENTLLSRLGVQKESACVIPVTEYVTNTQDEVIYFRDNFTFCK